MIIGNVLVKSSGREMRADKRLAGVRYGKSRDEADNGFFFCGSSNNRYIVPLL